MVNFKVAILIQTKSQLQQLQKFYNVVIITYLMIVFFYYLNLKKIFLPIDKVRKVYQNVFVLKLKFQIAQSHTKGTNSVNVNYKRLQFFYFFLHYFLCQQSQIISNQLKQPNHKFKAEKPMEISDEQFHTIISSKSFRKNQAFKSNRNNLERIIKYIAKMQVNDQSFQIIQYLIKQFGISILLCFQPFYLKFINDKKTIQKYTQKLQRISALVVFTVKPNKCGELNFFKIADTARKGFTVRQKTPQQLEFIKALEYIKKCMIIKKSNPKLIQIPNDQIIQLNLIKQKMANNGYNPFACYYLKSMENRLRKEYNKGNQQSTLDQTKQETELKKKAQSARKVQNASSEVQNTKTVRKLPQNQINKQLKVKNPISTNNQNTMKSFSLDQSQSFDQFTNLSINQIQQKPKQNTSSSSQRQKIKQIQKNNNKFLKQKLQKLQKQSKNNSSDQNLNTSDSVSFQNGHNFAKIPLCCRTFFFDQQRILPGQDKRTQYKSYRFPFNPVSIETFKKTICAFLNTIGGEIYIGIKETTNKKYRYVLGNYFTQNDKEEILKSFRKITESIFPNITQNLQVQFVPVRKSPFPDIDLMGHTQKYFYDFSKKPLDLAKCPYKPAMYVIRVRVPMGNKDSMYSYIQTDYQLNKNTTSNQFIPLRSQNQVLVKQISQEVLKKYKQKLLYGQQQVVKEHKGPCQKPQHGQPRNEPQPEEEMVDAKIIEASLHQNQTNMKKKRIQIGHHQARSKSPTQQYKKYQQNTPDQQHNKSFPVPNIIVTQQQLNKIFKYPLSFIVINLPSQRLKRCIQKTPAKNYTTIQTSLNQLQKDDLTIIKVNGYPNMDQFLKVKAQLQRHFIKQKFQLVGISRMIKLESNQNRRILEALLVKNNHKYAINNKVVEFYSLFVAAAYFLRMKHLGFKVEAIPD